MYCEAARVPTTIRRLSQSSLNDGRTEFLFVDDGSSDGTDVVVKEASAEAGLPARVLRLDRNRGKGAAVKAGLLEATGDVVAFVDADLSTDIPEIERCFEAVEAGRADVAFASRAHAASVIATHQPPLRQIAGKTFNVTLRLLGLTTHPDTQCGLKVLRQPAATDVARRLTIPGFAFDVELLDLAAQLGYVVEEVPVTWHHVEESRVRAVRDSLRMLLDVVLYRIRRRQAVSSSGDMATERFTAMDLVEDDHWWFKAKHFLAVKATPDDPELLVDVGCGTGGLLSRLAEHHPEATIVGVDPSDHALDGARRRLLGRNLVAACKASALAVPLPTGSADCLVSMDVIEHLDDDVAALREYARVVKPGGRVVIAVPAYAWAWSDHDVSLGHKRRYTAKLLRERMSEAGLPPSRVTYFHSWLVPLAFLLRKTPLRKLLRGSAEEASFVNPTANNLLQAITRTEGLLLGRVDIPFGLSVLGVAEVPAR